MLRTIDRHFELVAAMETLTRIRPPGIMDAASRAEMLESIARSLDEGHDDIIAVASQETALLAAELEPEFARMTGTLRMFAGAVREGAWVRAAIDRRASGGVAPIGPNHDIRSMLVPLGPVAVFGAGNFPLAYGVCGGDTASALAAGCAVVVKEHPAHPKTGRLILARAHEGIRRLGGAADEGVLGYVANTDAADFTPAQGLVRHGAIKGVGFTGSRRGGLAVEEIARSRPERIPVFAEMGSANPVIVTPAAAKSRGPEIAQQIAESVLARFGQQCTCPGIIVVPEAGGGEESVLADALAARLDAAPERDMLAPWIRDGYLNRLAEAAATPESRVVAGRPDAMSFSPRGARACAVRTTADRFAWHAELREEIFGPGVLIVGTPLKALASLPLPASLTLSIFFDESREEDVALAHRLVDIYGPLAGRVIFNGVPTGVRVAAAMVHGGPFPATNRPDTTAVGVRAIERWCRPMCWQNCPEAFLPEALRVG